MMVTLKTIPTFFLRPIRIAQNYRGSDLRADLLAGLTVGVVLLPQAVVFAILAGLPPEMGIYTAIVAAIVGALWGSSHHLHTGPTNTSSLLVLSTLLPLAAPGSPAFIAAAGLMALMVGIIRLGMGLARLGMLVQFVSDSVIVGFTAGVGLLIILGEARHLLRADAPASSFIGDTVMALIAQLPQTHWLSLGLGVGAALMIVLLQRIDRRLPGPLLAMVVTSAAVALFQLEATGVQVLGELPRSLPPLAQLPLFDLELIGHLSTGALAVAAIGLVEAASIARAIAIQSGQRLDNNQEFVGQGLANIACGLLSGYPCSSSFNRSALNYRANARTAMAGVFSGMFVLLALFVVAPLAAYVPRAALAGVLIVTAFAMIDGKEVRRIWRGARGDAVIMVVTLLATLLLPLQFAVVSGILMALGYYILQTSTPRVQTVLPDAQFRHLTHQPDKPCCCQLGIIDILGDLYFGAVNHIEASIRQNLALHPQQRFLLLRMQSVQRCDISGIHMLESIVRLYRERGGAIFITRVREPVLDLMRSTNFDTFLGSDHFLHEDIAIEYLFHKMLDPAVCIYECEVRAFRECQNLPKRAYPLTIKAPPHLPDLRIPHISVQQIWQHLRQGNIPLIIDVREPREFKQGHIPHARLVPLATILDGTAPIPRNERIVLVCRSGRRSMRAAQQLTNLGYNNIIIMEGGMIAWQAAGLLEAVELG